MLVHPRCSCSHASIGELAVLMAQAPMRPQTYVLFLKPGQFPHDWEKSPLWHRAASIPNVTVIRDDDGLEAARFGAATSGQTMLYDANGRLLFSGGITGSRGHAGDNAGARRFWRYFAAKRPDAVTLLCSVVHCLHPTTMISPRR